MKRVSRNNKSPYTIEEKAIDLNPYLAISRTDKEMQIIVLKREVQILHSVSFVR